MDNAERRLRWIAKTLGLDIELFEFDGKFWRYYGDDADVSTIIARFDKHLQTIRLDENRQPPEEKN